MEEFCERQDAAGILGYLETDRTENVAFYARFGFEVTETTTLHGVTNYFMRRRPASR